MRFEYRGGAGKLLNVHWLQRFTVVVAVCTIASFLFSASADAQTRPPDGLWGIVGVEAKLDQEAIVTAALMHLGGVRVTAPFIQVDRSVSSQWEVNVGYVWATQAVEGQKDPIDHFLRAGITYRHKFGPVLLENRLLYEKILNDRDRANGNRLRSRTRLTYKLDSLKKWEPRVLGYFEPVLDDRNGRPTRLELAVGVGATLPGGARLDVFALRQTYPARSRSGPSAVLMQLLVPINGTELQ